MRRFVIVVIILLFAAGLGCAKDNSVSKESESYKVIFNIDKNPPVMGDNNAQITIKDKSGAYITDATVEVGYSMPAMAGMPAMDYSSTAELKAKAYVAKLNFSMSGSWGITVKITRSGKIESVKFNVDVS
jgi:hypothetical protein